MKFHTIVLFSLLSGITLLSHPAASMRASDESETVETVIPTAKKNLTTKRSNLKDFLIKKDYPNAFKSLRKNLPETCPDEEIVDFLMTSNAYPEWDRVDPEDKTWVVAKITKEAKRKDLESFLSKQDYSGAFRSTKASVPHVSDAEIVSFLMTSNAYPGWDTVDPDTKRWVTNRITGDAQQLKHRIKSKSQLMDILALKESVNAGKLPTILSALRERMDDCGKTEIKDVAALTTQLKLYEKIMDEIELLDEALKGHPSHGNVIKLSIETKARVDHLSALRSTQTLMSTPQGRWKRLSQYFEERVGIPEKGSKETLRGPNSLDEWWYKYLQLKPEQATDRDAFEEWERQVKENPSTPPFFLWLELPKKPIVYHDKGSFLLQEWEKQKLPFFNVARSLFSGTWYAEDEDRACADFKEKIDSGIDYNLNFAELGDYKLGLLTTKMDQINTLLDRWKTSGALERAGYPVSWAWGGATPPLAEWELSRLLEVIKEGDKIPVFVEKRKKTERGYDSSTALFYRGELRPIGFSLILKDDVLCEENGKLFSTDGLYTYVIDRKGNIRVASAVMGLGEHIKLAEGKPVLAAGMIEIKDGKITYLSDESGHYMPRLVHFIHAIKKFKNVILPEAKIRHFAVTSRKDVEAHIKELKDKTVAHYSQASSESKEETLKRKQAKWDNQGSSLLFEPSHDYLQPVPNEKYVIDPPAGAMYVKDFYVDALMREFRFSDLLTHTGGKPESWEPLQERFAAIRKRNVEVLKAKSRDIKNTLNAKRFIRVLRDNVNAKRISLGKKPITTSL
ncbi:MAG: hypothetical protein JSR85_05835 [Proteobacteria bacterium]|nr:hypothetical protein [Pseudomonadota bacterium]